MNKLSVKTMIAGMGIICVGCLAAYFALGGQTVPLVFALVAGFCLAAVLQHLLTRGVALLLGGGEGEASAPQSRSERREQQREKSVTKPPSAPLSMPLDQLAELLRLKGPSARGAAARESKHPVTGADISAAIRKLWSAAEQFESVKGLQIAFVKLRTRLAEEHAQRIGKPIPDGDEKLPEALLELVAHCAGKADTAASERDRIDSRIRQLELDKRGLADQLADLEGRRKHAVRCHAVLTAALEQLWKLVFPHLPEEWTKLPEPDLVTAADGTPPPRPEERLQLPGFAVALERVRQLLGGLAPLSRFHAESIRDSASLGTEREARTKAELRLQQLEGKLAIFAARVELLLAEAVAYYAILLGLVRGKVVGSHEAHLGRMRAHVGRTLEEYCSLFPIADDPYPQLVHVFRELHEFLFGQEKNGLVHGIRLLGLGELRTAHELLISMMRGGAETSLMEAAAFKGMADAVLDSTQGVIRLKQ